MVTGIVFSQGLTEMSSILMKRANHMDKWLEGIGLGLFLKLEQRYSVLRVDLSVPFVDHEAQRVMITFQRCLSTGISRALVLNYQRRSLFS